MKNEVFKVNLPIFEGPFDLLLFFIERDELDIYDIPIAKITNDFLDYLQQMKILNIELASEFILMAANLMSIKAKTLIPRNLVNEHNQTEDPRANLVTQLIEYKIYKAAIIPLKELEISRFMKIKRGNQIAEIATIRSKLGPTDDLVRVDLFKLLKAFKNSILKFESKINEPKHIVNTYPFTVESQKAKLITILNLDTSINFEKIISICAFKIEFMFTFFAILELIQQQIVALNNKDDYNSFVLVQQKAT